MEKPNSAYRGDSPYVFVCYAHEDSDAVFPEIAWLNDYGVNVWYDEGISPGHEWSDEVARAILGCTKVFYFVSPYSVTSEHCRRELNFAQEEDREVVAIHLEATEVPAGLRLVLNNRQAILKHELSEEEFHKRLMRAASDTERHVVREAPQPKGRALSRPARIAAAACVFASIAVGIWWLLAWNVTPEDTDPAVVTNEEEEVPFARVGLRNSIAVLPFTNLSPNPDDAYFAAGIHEEILNQLAKIRELSVIARTSVQGYADGHKSVPAIAQELNVSHVMEGSVRYAGDRVRITTQLIDAKSGTQIWSESYDRSLGDIFFIQSDIARNVTSAMKVQFAVAERESIGKESTDNLEAYGHYIRAMALRRNLDSPGPVHDGLDQAIELDPNFAQAMAAKAWLYGFQAEAPFAGNVVTPESQRNSIQLAQEFAERALAIDAGQAEAHLALSIVDQYHRRWDGRISRAQTAYELNPNHYVIAYWYGRALLREGRYDEGVAVIERSIDLDPRNWSIHFFFGTELGWLGKWEQARQQLEIAKAMAPDFPGTRAMLALYGSVLGDHEVALENAQWVQKHAADMFPALLINTYVELGNVDDARRLLQFCKAQGYTERFEDNDWVLVYGSLGQVDAALDALDSLVANNYPLPFVYNLHDYRDHPFYKALRGPRFDEIASRTDQPL